MKYTIGALRSDDVTFYERLNKGWRCTGETITETWSGKNPYDRGSQTLVVFTGPYTRYGMCRDCGDHYIIARYSRYDRIDKGTFKVTVDVEDR